MKPEIIVVGSSNTDMVVKTDRLPAPGETVLGGDFMIAAGGKGANQAVAAARAGGKVCFITKVGNDIFGARTIKGLKKDRINVNYVYKTNDAPSGVALIMVDKLGENSIAVAPGANSKLTPKDVFAAESIFKDAKVLLVQLEIPLETVKAAIDLAFKYNLKIILNPAPAAKLPRDLFKKVTIITPNEIEAQILTGLKIKTNENDLSRIAQKLINLGVKNVIITLGENGVFVKNDAIEAIIPSFKVKPVDTTAAGDVFNGALAVAITKNMDLNDAIRFANAAAAISVTRPGAQPSAPRLTEIKNLLKTCRMQ